MKPSYIPMSKGARLASLVACTVIAAGVTAAGADPEVFIDFNTDPEGLFEVYNDGGPAAEWRSAGGVDDSGYFGVTDNTEYTRNTIIFEDITEGLALRGFDFTVDLRVGGGTDSPADGFSLNLVTPEDPLLQDPVGQGFAGTRDLGANEDNLPEEGSQTGLGVGLDAYLSGGTDVIGFSIRIDGTLITQVEASTPNGEAEDETSLQTGPQNLADPADPTKNLTWQPFRAFLDAETSEMTIQWKGKTLLDKEKVPWAPTSVRPVFAARTGGSNQNHHIDNLRLVMVPARLASMTARVQETQLIVIGTNGPESQFDPARLQVTLDLNADGSEEPIDPGEGVVDGTRRIYTFDPPPSFFAPGTDHSYTVTGADSLGNTFEVTGVWRVSPTNIFSGGFFTTRHVWTDGQTISSRYECQSALDDEFGLQGDITVRHPWAHFHDNADAPIEGDLSVPYPLWAEPDQIPDENIIAGERIGGGLGDRNDFAIESSGEFFLRKGGNIIFVVNSDDGFVLEIDGEEIGQALNRARGNTVMEKDLEAGTHTMRVIHWERGGGAGFSLYVSRTPGGPAGVTQDNFQLLSGFNIHDVGTEDTDGDGMDDFKENFFFGDLSRDGSGDHDGDGLADGRELELRADPTVRDTDGDGLEDGPEANDLKTSPSMADTDGDSLPDGQEVNDLKSDPTKADTDDDTFADNIEVALGTDPLSSENRPSAIIAVADGAWNDPDTWSDGQAPSAGKNYVAVGTVTSKLVSSTGTFAGDSLTLVGPGMTLELGHPGDAAAILALNNADVRLTRSAGLGGILDLRGRVHVSVGDNVLTLSSKLTGGAHLTFQGGTPEDSQGTVELTGEGSTFGGPVDIIGTDVAGLSAGSISSGSILLANGGLAYGTDYSSDISVLKIQGANFRLVLVGAVEVADVTGVDADGTTLFSLNKLKGPGPYDATALLEAFELDEGITGVGSITLLGTAADSDGDGLRDSWEQEHFDNLDAMADGDADGDGLTNLHEQSSATDPNVRDVVVEETLPQMIVFYDLNQGAGTVIKNAGGATGVLRNAHAGAWVGSGGVRGSGYLNFTQEGATGADSQHITTGIGGLEIPNESADSDYTMMAWTRFDTVTPGGDDEDNIVFGQLGAGNVLSNGARGGQYYMGHGGDDFLAGGQVIPGEWHHVAWRYKEGTQAIFVDGVEVASAEKGPITDQGEVVIGASQGDQDRDFSGDLDDIRIYDGAIPQAEIAAIAAIIPRGGAGSLLYSQNFDGFANDTTDLQDGAIIASNDGTNSVQEGALRMTQAGTNSTGASFLLPSFDASQGWVATFDFVVEHTGVNTPADGFSFNFGAIPGPEDFGAPAEEGYGEALPHVSYQVDTYRWDDSAEDAGVGIEVTGAEIAFNEARNDNANFKPEERIAASATLSWDPVDGASFTTTGLRVNADFSNVPTPGFTASSAHGFSIIARTGDHNETLIIDNLVVREPSVGLPDLLGYWRLDEGAGATVADGSGNGHDGTIVNPDGVWVDDPVRGTVYQSGDGSFIDFGTFLPVIDLDTNFTWSFWVNPNETDNNNIVFGNRWAPNGSDFAPREFITFTPRVFEWHFNGGAENVPGDNTLFEVGQWAHNLVVKSGDTLTYYRDGVELASRTITGAPANPQPLYLGGQNGNAVFKGLFDEVAVFDRALSAEEVGWVYQLGRAGEALPFDRRPPTPAGTLGEVFISTGGGISFALPEGTTADIQYSTDLQNWSVIASGVTGLYEDTDPDRSAAPAGFYRALSN